MISNVFNSLTIRTAEPEDGSAIAYLSRKTYFESFASVNSKRDMEKFLQIQFSVKSLINEVKRKHNTFLLAYKFHTLVGYAFLRDSQNPVEMNQAVKGIELVRLFVDKPHKGNGVGSALMKECVKVARIKNREAIWLSVWTENAKAVEFYDKWGFTRLGTKVTLLGDNPQIDLIMKKDLTK